MPKPLTTQITKKWKIPKEMGMPDYLMCLLRNLYASHEATVRIRHKKKKKKRRRRTGHGTID